MSRLFMPGLLKDRRGQAQGWAVTPFSNSGFHRFNFLNSVYIVDTKAQAPHALSAVMRGDERILAFFEIPDTTKNGGITANTRSSSRR
jgi:hypothetical protein